MAPAGGDVAPCARGYYIFVTVGRGLGRQRVQCVARLERLLETKRGITPKLCIVGVGFGCGPQFAAELATDS